MALEIYNTLSGKKETFEPRNDKKVQMFVCGPTVYDYIHIGNARTFVFFDVVAKYLKHKGYDVEYIQNITDIDNKIIERAQKEGADPIEYAKKFAEIFKQDMAALGVTAPEYKNATDHIPQVIQQVQTLLDKGKAYSLEGDGIYFDLSTFPDYGKLSGRTASMANDAVSRIDDSDKKRNKGDFAIWKFTQEGDPSWDAPFGAGRPGWHIEDTAITEKYFGPQYDIHGGGEDLKFPHHEAEIALEESVSDKKPFVKYWMHGGFLVNKDEKMSKSLGNFNTLREVLEKWDDEVVRHYLLSAHYKSPLNYLHTGEQGLAQSLEFILRITGFIGRLVNPKMSWGSENPEVSKKLDETKIEFLNSLDNDFNTPEAIASVAELIRQLNPIINEIQISATQKESILDFMYNTVDKVLRIIPIIQLDISVNVLGAISKRDILRKNGNYDEADKLRKYVENEGYKIEDTSYGPRAVKK